MTSFRVAVDRAIRMKDGTSSYPLDDLEAAGVSWSWLDELVDDRGPLPTQDSVREARLEVVVQHHPVRAFQRRLSRRNLLHHIYAVGVGFEHPNNPIQMAPHRL